MLRLVRQLSRAITFRRFDLILLSVLALGGALTEVLSIWATEPFLNSALGDAPEAPTQIATFFPANIFFGGQTLLARTSAFIFLNLLASMVRITVTWQTVRTTQGIGHKLAQDLFATVIRRPYSYHISRNTSEIIAAVSKVSNVINGVLTPYFDAVVSLVVATAIVVALMIVDWRSALSCTIAFLTLYLMLSAIAKKRLRANSRRISQGTSMAVRCVQEGFGSIREVILDNSYSFHEDKFNRADRVLRQAIISNSLWSQVPRQLIEGLGIGMFAVGAALFMESRGDISKALPILGALALGAQRLLPLLQRIYSGWSTAIGNQGSLEDIVGFFEVPDSAKSILNEREVDHKHLSFNRKIELRNLSFKYWEGGEHVIHGLSVTIRKGDRVGIIGVTGSGKSTLMDLIMGLLTPSEGSILIDGLPLSRWNVRQWQNRIAHVPQMIYLVDASITENIAFGEPPDRIDLERVHQAAIKAHIHEFILSLKHGYQTRVGERGVMLSGGQRQRIGIARALYRNADVLAFDEATSALDSETEDNVMRELEGLGREITIIMISHRLASLDGFNQIIEVSDQKMRRDGG
jgi:ABC-type bacteriocin/lantibiotic exporter with double-glycine peptidase domain